jgi:hypothetical protein
MSTAREFTDKRMLYNLDIEIEDINDLKVVEGNNTLLVESIQDTSKYVNTDILVVKNWHKALHATRFFRVIKAPKCVFFNPKYNHSVLYDTQMEVVEGDIIYINHLESLNSFVYTFKDKTYHTIKYDNIQCVVRGDEVIPVNGYVLFRPIEVVHKYLEHEVPELSSNEVIVEKVGIPNKDYKRNWMFEKHVLRKRNEYDRDKILWSDYGYEAMKEGDRVRVYGSIGFNGTEQNAYVVPLEQPAHRVLKTPYLIAHRPRIECVISK